MKKKKITKMNSERLVKYFFIYRIYYDISTINKGLLTQTKYKTCI